MTDKVVFIAFAEEDEAARDLFTGQSLDTLSPFSFVDMSLLEPEEPEWKDRVRALVRQSDGMIALISKNTPNATGELWEIQCAVEEKKPLLGLWIQDGYRTKPESMGTAPVKAWTWDNVASFVDSI